MSNTISSTLPAAPPPAPQPAVSVRPSPEAGAASVRPVGAEKVERGPDLEAGRRELKQAVDRLNEQARKDGRNLSFSMDNQADRVVITVRQSETGEVIRQIPDESLLKVAHNIEAVKGPLYNETT